MSRRTNDDGLFNFDFDGSMILPLILLVTFWPAGLIVLFNKLKRFKRGKNDYRRLKNMGITTMICALIFGFLEFPGWAATMFMAGAGITLFGRLDKKREERYRKYLSVIGGRSPVSLIEISAKVDEPLSTVRHDLDKMIKNGYFGLATYIDYRRNCIVLDGVDGAIADEQSENTTMEDRVSRIERDIRGAVNRIFEDIKHGINETVDTFATETKDGRRIVPDKSKVKVNVAVDEKGNVRFTPKVNGQENGKAAVHLNVKDAPKVSLDKEEQTQDQYAHYITEIREVNSRIADPEISEKIDQIEGITARIFSYVRKHPERTNEIRKFMNYYLPTTLKLLDSYALLEEQGIEGEHITASKQQIHDILDTLIKSYEKQLDQLFTSKSMDIASDIQVMETMLSADGLKENDFNLKTQTLGGK
ncbi:MAG: 5-bromo-4-chloroindolyl phosphate hydrolysis family protein [Clostridia bacterium]|nr:5-bromo-4-chloroindolyl phosphate hydrolysis family protein [Clostridia bacterium]